MSVPSVSIPVRRRPVRTALLTVAGGALVAASLTACSSSGTSGAGNTGGTGQKTPAMALSAGVQKISDGKSASFEITIKPDAKLMAAAGKGATAQDMKAAQAISGGISFKVTASADKPLKDVKPGDNSDVELNLSLSGTSYLDVRYVGGALYAKADVKDFTKLAGVPESVITDELGGGKIPAPLAGAAQAAVNGDWVGISAADMKSVQQLMSSFAGSGDLGATAPAGGSPLGAAQIPATIITALSKDATITDKGDGKLEISGKAKTLAQDLIQAVSPMMDKIPGASNTADLHKIQESLKDIPDSQNLTFDVTLKDGAVTDLSIDLAQFMTADQSGGGHLLVDVKIDQSAPKVSAPSGATMVDLNKVLSQMGGL